MAEPYREDAEPPGHSYRRSSPIVLASSTTSVPVILGFLLSVGPAGIWRTLLDRCWVCFGWWLTMTAVSPPAAAGTTRTMAKTSQRGRLRWPDGGIDVKENRDDESGGVCRRRRYGQPRGA